MLTGSPLPIGRMGAVSRAAGVSTLIVAAASIADNASAGSVVTPILAPSGYSLILLNDCGARFAISGSNLVTGTTVLEPGTHQPIVYAYRTTPVASGPDCFEVAPIITAVATRVPSDISGLVMSHRVDDAVLSGADINTIPGAHGTSVTLTGAGSSTNKPQIVTGTGPGGKNYASMNLTRARFTFPSQAPTNSTWVFVFGPNTIVTLDRTLVSDGTANNSIDIGNSATDTSASLKIRTTGMSAAATVTLTNATKILGANAGLVIIVVRLDITNQQAKVDINGVSAGAATTLTAATAQAWTNFFSNTSIGNASNGIYTASALYNKVLSDAEVLQVTAMMTPWRSRDHYFSLAGNDSNNGWDSAHPKLTPDSYIINKYGYAGDRVLLNGGDRFQVPTVISPYAAGTGSIGTATLPILIKTYGTGRAILSRSTKKAAGTAAWTSIGSGAWTTAFTGAGVAPSSVWLKTGATDADTGCPVITTFLLDAVVNGTWRHAWAANVLTIRLDDVLDPNSFDIEIPETNTLAILLASRAYTHWMDIDLCGGAIAAQNGGNGLRMHRMRAYCISRDVWNFQVGTDRITSQLMAYRQGDLPISYLGSSTSADGNTTHGVAARDDYNSIYKESYSYGGAWQQAGTDKSFDCRYLSNAKQANKLGDASTAGSYAASRCEFVRPAVSTNGVDTFDEAIRGGTDVGDSLETATTVTVTACKFTGLGTTRGKAVGLFGGTFVNGGGNTISGFNSLS